MVGACKDADIIVGFCGCSGVGYCQSRKLHREGGETMMGLVASSYSSSKSTDKKVATGYGLLYTFKLFVIISNNSLHKLPFLLQQFLQA
jgi:hypothetical protein